MYLWLLSLFSFLLVLGSKIWIFMFWHVPYTKKKQQINNNIDNFALPSLFHRFIILTIVRKLKEYRDLKKKQEVWFFFCFCCCCFFKIPAAAELSRSIRQKWNYFILLKQKQKRWRRYFMIKLRELKKLIVLDSQKSHISTKNKRERESWEWIFL